jgi:hypothetical protein
MSTVTFALVFMTFVPITFGGRRLLDLLMEQHPQHATYIDRVGQGLIGMAVVFVAVLPLFERNRYFRHTRRRFGASRGRTDV